MNKFSITFSNIIHRRLKINAYFWSEMHNNNIQYPTRLRVILFFKVLHPISFVNLGRLFNS